MIERHQLNTPADVVQAQRRLDEQARTEQSPAAAVPPEPVKPHGQAPDVINHLIGGMGRPML